MGKENIKEELQEIAEDEQQDVEANVSAEQDTDEKKEVQEEIMEDMVHEPVDDVSAEVSKKREKADLEKALYHLAVDVSNMRVNQAEANCYLMTLNEMGDSDDRLCEDGVRRDKSFYTEKYFQFFWHSKAQNITINRLMLEKGISINDLNEFMSSKINGGRETSVPDKDGSVEHEADDSVESVEDSDSTNES